MIRSRSTGGFATAQPMYQETFDYYSGKRTGWYTWYPGGPVGIFKKIDDVVTPNYYKRKRRGELILNDFSISTETAGHTSSGLMEFTHPNWGRVRIIGDIGGYVENQVGNSELALPGLDQIALIKATAKMKETPVLGGEILATLGQTISMLKRPFGSSLELIAKIERRKKFWLGKKAYNAAQAGAKAWLETRYGWKPLIGDAQSIMRTATKSRLSLSEVRVARASAKDERTLIETVDTYICSNSYRVRGTKTRTIKVRASAGIFYRLLPIDQGEAVLRQLGLHGQNVPSTVWELIPLSFVVDWFVNAGLWITAITPRSDIQTLGNWVTKVTDTTYDLSGGSMTRQMSNPTATYSGTWNPVSHKGNYVSRKVNQSLALTPLLLNRPLSIAHQIDGISLLLGKINQGLRRLR